jgi:hypothetical protein
MAPPPFKPKDTVYTKAKPYRKGVIVRATVGGKKHCWDVQLDEDHGEVSSFTSRQLIRNYPTAISTAAAAPPPALEETDISTSQQNEETDDDDDDNESAAPVGAFQHTDNVDSDSSDDLDGVESDDLVGNSDDLDEEDEDTDDDAEEGQEEGNSPRITADDAEEEDVPLHGEIPVEPEDIHKTKWEQYKFEKAALLLQGWTVTKAAKNSNQGISIGALVKTRRRDPREGTVVDETEVDGRKVWIVDFGDDEAEPMRPMQIQIVQHSNSGQFVWSLVPDSEADTPVEYVGNGLIGFNFTDSFKHPTGREANTFPYLRLLQKLWPGDWKQQLWQLNSKITVTNNSASNGRQKINAVSEREWWVFIGILISAGPQGKGGINLWEKSQTEGCGLTDPINYGPDGKNFMPLYRFKEVKAAFPWRVQDTSKADPNDEGAHDPWNMIMLMVEGYNANRHSWVAASIRKVLDESMSAWRPQTSKSGDLPHLSFILRKPEPLGTEFKTIACAVTGELSS